MIDSSNENRNEFTAEAKATADGMRRAGQEMLESCTVSGRALLRMLAIAHLRGLDASELVAMLAAEYPGPAGQQLGQLAVALSMGTPVVDALGQTPGVLDQTAVLAIRLANDSGNLSRLYEAVLESGDIQYSGGGQEGVVMELIGVGIGIFIAFLIITFLCLFIVPTFEVMFDEFGLTLPAPMLLVLAIHEHLPIVFGIGLALVMLYIAFQSPAIGESLRKRSNPLDGGRRNLPVSAGLLSLMAIALHCGRDMASGLSTIAKYHRNPGTRRRLDRACGRIERGSELWGALAAERIVSRREAQSLSKAASRPMQAWLLQWSIAVRQRRKTVRTHFAVRMLTLVSSLFMGAIVALTAVSVFLVLCELVLGLT